MITVSLVRAAEKTTRQTFFSCRSAAGWVISPWRRDYPEPQSMPQFQHKWWKYITEEVMLYNVRSVSLIFSMEK